MTAAVQSMQTLQLQQSEKKVSKSVESLKVNARAQPEANSKIDKKNEKGIKQSRSSDSVKEEPVAKAGNRTDAGVVTDERLSYADVMRRNSGKKTNSAPPSPSKTGKKSV